MTTTSRPVAIVAALVLGCALSSCTDAAPIPPESVVGSWQAGDSRLELAADGSFDFYDVPLDVVDPLKWDDSGGRDPVGPLVSVQGAWEYLPDGDQVNSDPHLVLFYAENQAISVDGINVYTFVRQGGYELGIQLGDPDRYNYFILKPG